MNEIKMLTVTIKPSYVDGKTPSCEVRVATWGNPDILITRIIDNSDFESRLDYFFADAVKEIKRLIREKDNGT